MLAETLDAGQGDRDVKILAKIDEALNVEINLVSDKKWKCFFILSFVAIYSLYITKQIGHAFTAILSTVLIASMVAHQGRVKSRIREIFLESLSRNEELNSNGDGDFSGKAIGRFNSYYDNAVEVKLGFSIVFVLVYFIAQYISFSRILIHFEEYNVIIKYIFTGIISFLFSIWLSTSLFGASQEVTLQDQTRLKQMDDYANWAESIKKTDLDDIMILSRRNILDRMKSRAETLTNESVLFSALSFSAFLAISMADKVNFDDIRIDSVAFSKFLDVVSGFVTGNIRELGIDIFEEIRSSSIVLISLSLLTCSLCFLCTIIARTRFNDRYHDADALVRAAEWLNEKEEEEKKSNGQIELYRLAIFGTIRSVDAAISPLKIPILQMKVFRVLGLMSFLTCTLICANMFSQPVLIACGSIVVLSIFIEMGDGVWQYFRRSLNLRENKLAHLFGSADHRNS